MTAFVYHGKVEKLQREVTEAQDALNTRYRKILGEERYSKLEEASRRFLTSDIFFDKMEEVNKIFEKEHLPEKITSDETSSKFIIAVDCDSEVFPNGAIRNNKSRVGIGFYVSEKSFLHSGALSGLNKSE